MQISRSAKRRAQRKVKKSRIREKLHKILGKPKQLTIAEMEAKLIRKDAFALGKAIKTSKDTMTLEELLKP